MKTAVLVFPGSNCDRDMAVALERATGKPATMVWHKETTLPGGVDLVAIPGGFSFGDYLRCGAIAARAPIMAALNDFAARGGMVLGVCNGWQVLIEAGLLPGALMRNADLKYICREVSLRVETVDSPFTNTCTKGGALRIPIAHHDGNFIADKALLAKLNDADRVAFRYIDSPNGATDDIAGVLSENRRVLGMMPHPERLYDAQLGGNDGACIFDSMIGAMVRG